MASFEQELVFGEFDDLIGEEHAKIHNILHGQVRQTTPKVEFPWDDEVRGAYGDSTNQAKSWAEDAGVYNASVDSGYLRDMAHSPIQFGFMPDESLLRAPPGMGGEYRNPNMQFEHEGGEMGMGQGLSYDVTDQGQDENDMYLDRAGQQSKLQASLKPYERRNKKKRPPNYYKQSDTGMPTEYGGYTRQMIPQAMILQNFTVPPPGHPAHYGVSPTNRGQVNMGSVQTMAYPNYPAGAYNVNNPQEHVGPGFSDPNVQGQIPFNNQNTVNPTVPQNSPLNAGVPHHVGGIPQMTGNARQQSHVSPHKGEELLEVVVDKVPNNSFHIPSRTETYQNQDHERTSIESESIKLSQQYASDNRSNNLVSQTNVQQDRLAQELSFGSVNSIQGAKSNRVDVSIKDAHFVEVSSHKSSVEDISSTKHSHIATPPMQGNDANSGVISNTEELSAREDENKSDSNISTGAQESASRVPQPVLGVPQESGTEAPTQILESGPPPQQTQAPVVPQPEAPKPKPSSWAGLFKSSSAKTSMAPPPTYGSDSHSVGGSNSTETTETEKEELPPIMPVPAAEDSVAKELGERLAKMTISHSTVALQPRGLVNRGNWCYINGTLQALIACPPFYNLLRKLPRYPALSRGPSSTPIMDSLVEFVHEFHPMSRNNDRGQPKGSRDIIPGVPFEPVYVYKMLQTIAVNPHFKLGKQEDAEEFLSCILDGMHEEMSAAVNLNSEPNHTGPEGEETEEGYTNGYTEGEGEENVAGDEESWEQVGPKKKSVFTRRANFAKSPIADIFAGMIRSAIYKAATKETATLQPFFTLQLDIQSEKVWSVQDALEELVSKEPISGYTCSTTNSEMEVMKKLSLEELPPVLVLHLKCFVYNKDGGSQKLMKKVDYKVELEITKDLLSPNAKNKLSLQQRSYKLFAVVYHHGKKATGGHYTTNVFHPGINGWVNSDDSQVKTVHVSQVLKYSPPRVPYLLYYRRLDSH